MLLVLLAFAKASKKGKFGVCCYDCQQFKSSFYLGRRGKVSYLWGSQKARFLAVFSYLSCQVDQGSSSISSLVNSLQFHILDTLPYYNLHDSGYDD